jgi:hypothetical protein
MEDALGRVKPLMLTRGWWKRSWFLEVRLEMNISGARGARQGASEASPPTLPAVEKAAAREHHPEWCSALPRNGFRGCERWSRSSVYAVKRTSIWGRVAARQHGAGTAKGVEAHFTVGRNEARYRSVTAKASRSEIGRSTGARVVCRLQKSVRSILSSPTRGEPRGKL